MADETQTKESIPRRWLLLLVGIVPLALGLYVLISEYDGYCSPFSGGFGAQPCDFVDYSLSGAGFVFCMLCVVPPGILLGVLFLIIHRWDHKPARKAAVGLPPTAIKTAETNEKDKPIGPAS